MAWISKKAKAQIRARRKKKEKLSKNQNQDHENSSTNNNENNENPPHILSKRKREEEDSNNNVEKMITITIPSTMTSKEAKKERKQARRKLRKEGKDENLLRFVDEDGNPIVVLEPTPTSTPAASKDGDVNNDDKANDNEETEENEKAPKRRKTTKSKPKSFPNINEILATVAKAEKESLEQQKKKSYEDSIPSEIKDQYMALDCEMVGIGPEGKQSALARVSITNWNGETVLDTFVQVPDRVTDFRTYVSGVRAKDIQKSKNSNAMELHACRKKVADIIHQKILIGHSLKNDFDALMLGHPKHLIRDTARYKPFMRASGRNGGKLRPRKLRDLVKEHVGLIIQKEGEAHTSVEDAQATMELYKSVRQQWEKELEKKEAAKSKKKR